MPSVRARTSRTAAVPLDAVITNRRETATSAARDLGPCVYVVRLPERLIKIGFTTNLDRRIRSFGSVWSDVLLALPGTPEDEAALHDRFKPYLARGREYYYPCRELVDWIDGERNRLGVSKAG